MRGVLLGVVLLLCLSACGDGKSDLESASGGCTKTLKGVLADQDQTHVYFRAEDFLTVGDDGDSLTLATPEESKLAAASSVALMTCLLDRLKAPDSVTAEVGQTTAMMGRQSADWDDIEVDYSYHPDSGVSAVFRTK